MRPSIAAASHVFVAFFSFALAAAPASSAPPAPAASSCNAPPLESISYEGALAFRLTDAPVLRFIAALQALDPKKQAEVYALAPKRLSLKLAATVAGAVDAGCLRTEVENARVRATNMVADDWQIADVNERVKSKAFSSALEVALGAIAARDAIGSDALAAALAPFGVGFGTVTQPKLVIEPPCEHPAAEAGTLKIVYPPLPREARLAHAQGTVVSEVDLDAEGLVESATVSRAQTNVGDSPVGKALERAALYAASETAYTAEVVNCHSVAGSYLFRSDFDVASDRPSAQVATAAERCARNSGEGVSYEDALAYHVADVPILRFIAALQAIDGKKQPAVYASGSKPVPPQLAATIDAAVDRGCLRAVVENAGVRALNIVANDWGVADDNTSPQFDAFTTRLGFALGAIAARNTIGSDAADVVLGPFGITLASVAHPEPPAAAPCKQPDEDVKILKLVDPPFPALGIIAHARGSVVVQVDINVEGLVEGARVYRTEGVADDAGGKALKQAALYSASETTYRAEVLNCQSIPGSYLMKSVFD